MDILDELLSLDIVHAVHTRNTVTRWPLSAPDAFVDGRDSCRSRRCGVPDGENTSGLGKTGLFLDTTDPLLEDGGDLGRRGLCVGGIGADGAVVERSGCAGLNFRQHPVQRESSHGSSAATPNHLPSSNAAPMASKIGSGSWR